MIRSGLIPGVVFGTSSDGDGRADVAVRKQWSEALTIPDAWATVSQVHGAAVVNATEPGHLGEADGLVTQQSNLPIAIATADCLPIALAGETTVALVHAGWRGIADGVIGSARELMVSLDDEPLRAAIGPHIGACCYEVGDEVIEGIGGFAARTRAGTTSADLGAAASARLAGLEIETIGMCTKDDPSFASHRRDATPVRQVAVAWRT